MGHTESDSSLREPLSNARTISSRKAPTLSDTFLKSCCLVQQKINFVCFSVLIKNGKNFTIGLAAYVTMNKKGRPTSSRIKVGVGQSNFLHSLTTLDIYT